MLPFAGLSSSVGAPEEGAFTPFPFVTVYDPPVTYDGTMKATGAAIDLRAKPPFNAFDPRSQSWIDPMTGFEVFRITGDRYTPVLLRGNVDSGLLWPSAIKAQNAVQSYDAWNCDNTLLCLPEWKKLGDDGSYSNLVRTVMINTTGAPIGAVQAPSRPWQIVRASGSMGFEAGSSEWFWSPTDPLLAYLARSDGWYEWFPVGDPARGMAVGQMRLYMAYPSGYSGWYNHGAPPSRTGNLYFTLAARENGSGLGHWGGIRFDLTNKTAGVFVRNPDQPNDDNDRGAGAMSPLGGYGHFSYQDHNGDGSYSTRDWIYFRWSDGRLLAKVNSFGHSCGADVDGAEYRAGNAGGGWQLENPVTGARRMLLPVSTGAYHIGSSNLQDTFEKYPQTPGGSLSGIRYLQCSMYGPGHVFGLRTGKNDLSKVRYIVNSRGTQAGRNSAELHPHISNGAEYLVFNSNWCQAVVTAENHVNNYVVIIPDAWKAKNNSGLSDDRDW